MIGHRPKTPPPMKSAKIYMYDRYAGQLTEDENGFRFTYDAG